MHIPINVEVLNECLKVARNYPTATDSILASLSKSQLLSKYPIVQDIEKNNNIQSICILAGWYSIGFNLLFTKPYNITSVDVDSRCELIGSKIFKEVSFITEDLVEYEPQADVVINTSTEHIEESVFTRSFDKIRKNTLCYFQNNNMTWMEGHVNCYKKLTDFENVLLPFFDVVRSEEIKIIKTHYTGIRYNIKCIRK